MNLIGDHTDYTGGLVLPMTVPMVTTVELIAGGDRLVLQSDVEAEPVDLSLDAHPGSDLAPWARFVAGVVAELRPPVGGHGTVTSTLPLGAGLSSSTSLTTAVALAVGLTGAPHAMARACWAAEVRATGVESGIMDQLVMVAAAPGHATLIDCRDQGVTHVPMPEGLAFHVVHSGVPRRVASSPYAERRAACASAAHQVGHLRDASLRDIEAIHDPVIRRRARHVVTENARVLAFVAALSTGDAATAGAAMVESHRSLSGDFDASVPALDGLVERLLGTPGVHGARLTGAGWGGCAVALVDATADLGHLGGWRVHPAGPATVTTIAQQ